MDKNLLHKAMEIHEHLVASRKGGRRCVLLGWQQGLNADFTFRWSQIVYYHAVQTDWYIVRSILQGWGFKSSCKDQTFSLISCLLYGVYLKQRMCPSLLDNQEGKKTFLLDGHGKNFINNQLLISLESLVLTGKSQMETMPHTL